MITCSKLSGAGRDSDRVVYFTLRCVRRLLATLHFRPSEELPARFREGGDLLTLFTLVYKFYHNQSTIRMSKIQVHFGRELYGGFVDVSM